MKLAKKILMPFSALCLFSWGTYLAPQERQFHQLVAKQWPAGAINGTVIAMLLSEQVGDRETNPISAPSKVAQSSLNAMQVASLPKGRLLFAPNSVNLTTRSRKSLECAAAWLREHRGDRVLVVGYCDDSGSETCTGTLAERRADEVRQFLLNRGIQADQIAGVKAWEHVNGSCQAGVVECQRQNRSARLFRATPIGSFK